MKTADAVARLRKAEAELALERALRMKAQAEVGGLRSAVTRMRALVLRQRAQQAERAAGPGGQAAAS
jgi:hypothetical protein